MFRPTRDSQATRGRCCRHFVYKWYHRPKQGRHADSWQPAEQRVGPERLLGLAHTRAGRGGTVGFALPGVSLRVHDEQEQPVPTGQIGGIQVKGPNVFKGYWRMPEKTAEEFTQDGFFRTGDVGKIDPQGYVTIVGRCSDHRQTGSQR